MRQKAFTPWVVGGAIVLLLVAGALVLLTRAREDDGTLERVQATGELRVGLDASFPPFESLDANGNIVGYDADLARAIARALGAEPVFVNIGFDGLYDALQADRVDVVISGLPYDPRRTQDVIYSQPYFNAGQVLVVRADDETFSDPGPGTPDPIAGTPDRGAGISDRGPGTPDRSAGTPGRRAGIPDRRAGTPNRGDGIPDGSAGIPMPALSGRIVAVEWGSLADMETRRLKEIVDGLQTLPQPTAQDALGALVAGQADAAVADAVSVFQFIGGEGGEQVRIAETLTDGQTGVLSDLSPHPNVVRFHKRLDEGCFLLEWLEGKPLQDYLPPFGSDLSWLTPRRVVELGYGISSAMDHINREVSADFIHNDLTPRNIMVEEPGPSVRTWMKLIDLGLCVSD